VDEEVNVAMGQIIVVLGIDALTFYIVLCVFTDDRGDNGTQRRRRAWWPAEIHCP
jgi:hypothetical protein